MVLFTELLESVDFGKAVGNLAREFREKQGLPDVHQLGLVVSDVEAAASELESRGIGPPHPLPGTDPEMNGQEEHLGIGYFPVPISGCTLRERSAKRSLLL